MFQFRARGNSSRETRERAGVDVIYGGVSIDAPGGGKTVFAMFR